MVEPEFITTLIILGVAVASVIITLVIYFTGPRPVISVNGANVRFTSKKDTRTYSPELIYVPGNPCCIKRDNIDTMHVSFSICNPSQHILQGTEEANW